MEISTKIAYLKGLADGLELAEESKEGKAIAKIIEVLEDMSEAIDDLYDGQDDIMEFVEAIDEDLSEVEDFLEDECDDCDCECDECDCEDSEFCGLHHDNYMEVECPECGETVCFYTDGYENEDTVEFLCPNCDSIVYTIDNYMLDDDDEYELEEEDIED